MSCKKVQVKIPLVSITANTDYTMPGCGTHHGFHGLEPAVGLHPALWTTDHTTSTTCWYLPGFYRYQVILLGDRGT